MYNNSMLYIEDILVAIAENYLDKVNVSTQDHLILTSFYNIHNRGDSLTKSQGQLLLKILTKYKLFFSMSGLDYDDALKNPEWKSKFRSLDLTRKVFVDKDTNGRLWIYLKFPYQLKESFEKFSKTVPHLSSVWNHDKKARQVSAYDTNIMALNDFVSENGFQIDESFMELMSSYEEILNQQDTVLPSAIITNNRVVLVNASEETTSWFDEKSTGKIADDLLLAKSMGYVLASKPETIVEHIAASDATDFWIKNPRDFLEMIRGLAGKFALILDRSHTGTAWLKEFTETAESVGFTPDEIKICFRHDKDQGTDFNDWIKEKGYGGKVEDGKIYIFNHKPPKWVFKNPNEIKIICTNNIYPPTDSVTKDWFNNHYCVVYLGEITPSKHKDKKIVSL